MSIKIIQVSTLTITTSPCSHKHKTPWGSMTIHNTPDDLIGPPSLNPHSRMHGWARTHMQRDGKRGGRTVIWPLCPLVCLSALLKKRKAEISPLASLRPPQAGETEHHLFHKDFGEGSTCASDYSSWNMMTLETQLPIFSLILE